MGQHSPLLGLGPPRLGMYFSMTSLFLPVTWKVGVAMIVSVMQTKTLRKVEEWDGRKLAPCSVLFVSPQNPYVEILTANVMVLLGRTFGRWSGHKGGTFMNGVSDLIKDALEAPLPSLPCENTRVNRCFTRHWIWLCLIWNFTASSEKEIFDVPVTLSIW